MKLRGSWGAHLAGDRGAVAAHSIDSGAARARLEALIELSQKLAAEK